VLINFLFGVRAWSLSKITPRTLVVGGPHLTPAVMIIPPAMTTMCVFMKESVALAFFVLKFP